MRDEADHTVLTFRVHLRVHADILINGVCRHRQSAPDISIQMHGVATLHGSKHRLINAKMIYEHWLTSGGIVLWA